MYKSKIIKNSNRDRILECIYRNPGISRKEISDFTGITPATVTTTVALMVKEEIIFELGEIEESKKSQGRRKIALDINPSYGCVIGIEFTINQLTICATDLKGEILYTDSSPHTEIIGKNITEELISRIKNCENSIGKWKEKILGLGIAVPGHMDEQKKRLICSRTTWRNFDGEKIRDICSYPVVFENNVRCMAVAKYLMDPLNTPSNFALFHVGYGMFCANIAEDELYVGTTYGSGEISHSIAVPDGKKCGCGRRGCLQTVASEEALLESAATIFLNDKNSLLHNFVDDPQDLNIYHIIKAYSMGDFAVRYIVSHALKYLTIAILNISILMNPEKLFLHGRLFNNKEIREELLKMTQELLKFPNHTYKLGAVEAYESKTTDGAVGAASLAILKCICNA